jgi:tetratricopeptide (TPR) repeat protein
MLRLTISLLALLLGADAWVTEALANIQPDLGSQDFAEVQSLAAEKAEEIAGLAADQMARGETAAALATIAQGLARFPDDPGLLERQADIYASLPVWRYRAPGLYRTLLTRQPDNLAVKNKLADTLLALRQVDQAEALFQEILAAAPDNPEAHLGLGRLYQSYIFYTLAAHHYELALKKMPENQAAREGLNQVRGLITPQLQALAGYFEDAEGFQRTFLYSSYRLYLHPRLRLYGGYGYLTYDSGAAFFPKNFQRKTLHRHVLPLVLQYRPVRTVLLELAGAYSDYGRWGQSSSCRTSAFWQAKPGTGLSLSYSYHDVIDFFGPFRGPWGLYFDDFTSYGRYRYVIVNPIGLWSQSFFSATGANTQSVVNQVHAHSTSLWGYQFLGKRLILSGFGELSAYTDNNVRHILGSGLQFRVLMNPLFKIKYSFAYGDYKYLALALASPGAGPSYYDFQSIKLHTWGAVLEKNWGGRAKLVLESNFNYSQQLSNPWVKGFNALAEINYLLTYHLSLRIVGFYAHNVGPGSNSYQMRNISGGLSYRF